MTDPLDNNKRFMYQFGLKARRGYEGEEEFNREREGYYETPLNKDEPSTLYALWAEPAAATVTVTPPKCGTVLTKDVYHSAGRFTPVPGLTVSGNASIRDESFEFTNWLIENADDYQVGDTVTLTGENTYSGRLFLNTEWGYFLDSSTAEDAITVVGGTLVSCDTDGKVVISVPVEHSYDENGICTGCGAHKAENPEFMSKSLVLSGQIGVNFFMKLPEIEGVDYSNSYMTFSISGKGTTTVRDDYDPTFKNKSGNGYYGFTCYVNSIQMAETITAVFHYGDGQTVTETYSIKQYLESLDAKAGSFDDTTVALFHALADYGHYVQPFLSDVNGWTIDTHYAEMDKYYTDSYTISDVTMAVADYAISREHSDADIEKITYTLALDSGTDIRVYFKPVSGYSGSFTVTVDGNTWEAEKKSDGRYLVTIQGISAHLLGTSYTIVATTDAGSATVKVSALSYVQGLLSAYTDSRYQNAAASIYNYYMAAQEYKANH